MGDEYVEKLADQFIAERGEKANGGCLDAVKQAVYADFYGWYIRRASHG